MKWSKNIKISDPMEQGCRLGPVVSKGQVNQLSTFSAFACDEKLKCVTFSRILSIVLKFTIEGGVI